MQSEKGKTQLKLINTYILFSVFNSMISRLNREGVKVSLLECCAYLLSCVTLCDPRDCSPPVSSVRGDSLGKDTGVGCHTLLRGIFPTQGSNPGLQHCRQTLYRLSHQGSLFLEQHFPKCTRIFFFPVYNSLKVQKPGIPFVQWLGLCALTVESSGFDPCSRNYNHTNCMAQF